MQFLSSERGLSQSLTNLPKVTVTDLAGHSHLKDEFQETKSRSQPCSPRPSRRAFTTCIAGTRYIIGELCFLKYLHKNILTWLKKCWLGCKASTQSLQRLLIIMSSYSVAHSTCLPKGWGGHIAFCHQLWKKLCKSWRGILLLAPSYVQVSFCPNKSYTDNHCVGLILTIIVKDWSM